MKEERIVLIGKSLTVNDKGKILMVRRHRPWHKESHDKWELPGGKLEFGEDPKKTCERETLEESGYLVKSTELLKDMHSHIWEHEDRRSHVIVFCYAAKLIGGEKSTEDKGVSEIKWFEKTELPKKDDCIPGTLEFINEYLK